MKVSIELEISPEEIPLATELLRTIRQLSDQIRLKSPSRAHFKELIKRCADSAQLDSASADVISLLGAAAQGSTSGDNGSTQTDPLKDLLDAFLEILFDPSLHPSVQGKRTVLPYLRLIPMLPVYAQSKLSDACKKEVTRRLMEPRPIGSSRSSVFHYADAMAGLVFLEKVNVKGMLTLCTRLLSKGEDYQMATVTALGRAIELCSAKIIAEADPESLAALAALLSKVHEDFRYDADYISTALSLSPQPHPGTSPTPGSSADAQGMSQSASSTPTVLFPAQSFPVPEGVNALVWDEPGSQIISATGKGSILCRTLDGRLTQELDLKPAQVHLLDIMPQSRCLFAYALRGDMSGSSIMCFKESRGTWREAGRVHRPHVLCVRALGADLQAGIATAESDASGKEGIICVYETNANGPFGGSGPFITYTEHQQRVSCLAPMRSDTRLFMSGSVDNTVRLFDRRVPSSTATLHSGTAGMVTCMDSADGSYFVTGSYETHGQQGSVRLWDWRYVSQNSSPVSSLLTSTSVLAVACGHNISKIAFSTLTPQNWLYSATFSSAAGSEAGASPVAVPAAVFEDGRGQGTYNSLKWGPGFSTLFAAGDAGRIDTYTLS